MTKGKSTKRALLLSGLSLLLSAAMLVGSTFAWFTDSVTNGGNIIQAGNLKVDLIHVGGGAEDEDVSLKETPAHRVFDCERWEPGYTVMETLRVVNEGDLAFAFRLDIVTAGATTGPAGESLADVIDVYVYEGDEEIPSPGSFADVTEANGWRNAGTLSALMADADGVARGELLPEGAKPAQDEPVGSVQMTVALHMRESAGNVYQGLSLGNLSLALNATQYTYETDGFGSETYDEGAVDEIASGISISGIEGLEGQIFDTIEEAYEAGNAIVAKGGLGEEALTDEQFDAIYNDEGRITWTIYGAHALADNQRILTFGRASNRYSSTRSISEIRVVGGNDSAQLYVLNIGLPYAWWNDKGDALSVRFSGLKLTGIGDQITCSRAYGAPLNVSFDNCDITGRIYHYFNGRGKISITNCRFTDNGTTQYAFMVQGHETEPLTIDFSNNTVTGYTRGINIQQATADVTIRNNRITSTNSESDRGAIQLTDAAECTVEGNTIDVNGGNAFWFHEAATNENVAYTINNNDISAPYLANADTSFDINSRITSSGNSFNDTDTKNCMEKGATAATPSMVTAIK